MPGPWRWTPPALAQRPGGRAHGASHLRRPAPDGGPRPLDLAVPPWVYVGLPWLDQQGLQRGCGVLWIQGPLQVRVRRGRAGGQGFGGAGPALLFPWVARLRPEQVAHLCRAGV